MLRPMLTLLCAAALTGCAPPDSEAELRRVIAAAEAAAESRNTSFFRDLIAAGYADERGNDREQLVSMIRGYFLVHSDIEVVSRIEEVSLLGEDAARVVVQAGLVGRRAGRPVLGGLQGDLYRIELELVRRSGSWQVIGARWERSLRSAFQ